MRTEPVLAFGLGLGAVSHLWLVLGALHWYTPAIAWALWTIGAVGAVDLSRRLTSAVRRLDLRAWTADEVTLLGLQAALGLVMLLGGLVPAHAADALRHHFNIAAIFVRAGGLVFEPIGLFTQPQGGEMFYAWALLLGSPRAGTVTLAVCGVVCAFAAGLAARSLGGDRRTALIASAIVLATPLIWYMPFEAKIDLVYLMHTALALGALARWRETRDGRALVVAAAFVGFAASAKALGLAVALALGVVVLASRCRAAHLAAGAGMVIAVGAPWYARTYLDTGDPLWPLLSPNAAAFSEARERLAVLAPLGRGAGGFLHGIGAALAGSPLLFGRALIGPLFLCGIPLAAAHARRAAWLGGFALAYYALWFQMSQQCRYLLPALVAAAVLAALGLGAASPLARAAVPAWAAISLVLAFTRLAAFGPAIAGAEPTDAFLARTTSLHREIAWMNAHLPSTAVVATDQTGVYRLERRAVWLDDFQGYVDWPRTPDVETLRGALAHHGATHALVTDGAGEDLLAALVARCGTVVYENPAAVIVDSVLLGTRHTTRVVIVALSDRCR